MKLKDTQQAFNSVTKTAGRFILTGVFVLMITYPVCYTQPSGDLMVR